MHSSKSGEVKARMTGVAQSHHHDMPKQVSSSASVSFHVSIVSVTG